MKCFFVIVLFGFVFCGVVWVVIDIYEFVSDVECECFCNLIQELCCLKCQNQDIVDFNVLIVVDLCKQIYGQLQQGKSDGEIVDYMVVCYGDFVCYKLLVNECIWLFWFGLGVLLLFGVLVIGVIVLCCWCIVVKV